MISILVVTKSQCFNLLYIYTCLDFQLDLKLRYVRIYFDATTFDRITKDRAAKFVDMLSSIGGTMGLLSGFSFISGVEIIYFTVRGMVTAGSRFKRKIKSI